MRQVQRYVFEGGTRKHQVFWEIQEIAIAGIAAYKATRSIEDGYSLRHEIDRAAERKFLNA